MEELDSTPDNLVSLGDVVGVTAVLKKQAIDTFKGVMKRCLEAKFACSTLDFRDRGMPMFSFELVDDDVILTVRRDKGTLGSDFVYTHKLEDILKEVHIKDGETSMLVTLFPHDSFEYRDAKGRNKEVELKFYFFRDVKFNGINTEGKRYTCMYSPDKVMKILNGKIKEEPFIG